MSARLAAALRSLVSRGKVTAAAIGNRTLLQVTGLAGEVKQSVALLLPPGYSARPLPGADVLLLQVLGSRDHVVAVGGDFAGQDAIANLAQGEFGLRHAATGAQIVFRNSGTHEITGGTWRLNGDLHVTGAVIAGYGGGDQVGLQTHTHRVPAQPGGGVTSNAPSGGS
jgi:phage gp45-like